MDKSRLNQFTLDIEFLLISAVQGVALGALGTAAAEPLVNLDFQYWPYILSGFLLVLTFWSQAIIHSLSFIKWPLDLAHNFLYFLLGLVEFLAFTQLQDPLRWFIFQLAFVVVGTALYLVDLKLIKGAKPDFKTGSEKALYNHVLGEQKEEIKTLIPSGIIFNSLAVFLIWKFPEVFLISGYHIYIVGIQVLLTIYIMSVSFKSFKKRSKLISDCL
jgi:hypothetical protein